MITYETFVEELDVGDSFTTTLTDALVKVRGEPLTQDIGLLIPSVARRSLLTAVTVQAPHNLAWSLSVLPKPSAR